MCFSRIVVMLLTDKNIWKYYRDFLELAAHVVNIRPYRLKELIGLCCTMRDCMHKSVPFFGNIDISLKIENCENTHSFIYDSWIKAEICSIALCTVEDSRKDWGRNGEREVTVRELQNTILNFIATVPGILKLIRFSRTILIIESIIWFISALSSCHLFYDTVYRRTP